MKSSGIGGQAVIEGVMMKNKDVYAVAVRKPGNEIAVEKGTWESISEKYKILKLPILRGVLAFIESMTIGMKTLTFSASFYEEEEEVKPGKVETAFSKIFKGNAEKIVMGLTVLLSIVMAIGIFMILPFFISEFFQKHIDSQITLAIIEGVFRIFLFIAYVMAISQMKDIKRVFQYHGAEHKTINCIEHGYELTVENVRPQSKEHKRCGTSFMLVVMFFSIIFFLFIKTDTLWLRIVTRLLLVPVIAGVSYEFIQLAGRSDSKIMGILSKPGLWLQGLTTKEPEDDMIEVAIQSVEAVFDWRAYLTGNKTEEEKEIPEKEQETSESENALEEERKTGENIKKVSEEKKKTSGKEERTSEEEKKTSERVKKASKEEKENSEKEKKTLESKNKTSESKKKTSEKEKKTSERVKKASKGEKESSEKEKKTSESKKKISESEKKTSEKTKKASKGKETLRNEEKNSKKVMEEYGVSLEKDIDEDEDDEILRALDRYFIEKRRSDGQDDE